MDVDSTDKRRMSNRGKPDFVKTAWWWVRQSLPTSFDETALRFTRRFPSWYTKSAFFANGRGQPFSANRAFKSSAKLSTSADLRRFRTCPNKVREHESNVCSLCLERPSWTVRDFDSQRPAHVTGSQQLSDDSPELQSPPYVPWCFPDCHAFFAKLRSILSFYFHW